MCAVMASDGVSELIFVARGCYKRFPETKHYNTYDLLNSHNVPNSVPGELYPLPNFILYTVLFLLYQRGKGL